MAFNPHGTSSPKVVHFGMVALLCTCSLAMGNIQNSQRNTCDAANPAACSASGASLLQLGTVSKKKQRSINGVPVITNSDHMEHPEDNYVSDETLHNWVVELNNKSFVIVKDTSFQNLENVLPEDAALVEEDAHIDMYPVTSSEDEMVSSDVASWGLDRTDQRRGLDSVYTDGDGGAGVHVYVLDTGVRTSHTDFGGRAIPTYSSHDSDGIVCSPSNTSCADDGHGHGTHCAGTVAGLTYGIAKQATIHAVKVLSDQGGGTYAGIILALSFVKEQHMTPAVASMSLGGSGTSSAMQDAMDSLFDAGVTTVVAAGNSNSDACSFTPAHIPSAITVGSSTSADHRSLFSNYGTCLDIYAPGTSITSAWKNSDTDTKTISGTSMACPHVAGGVALLYQLNPSLTPTQMNEYIGAQSTKMALNDIHEGEGGWVKNRLLYSGMENDTTAEPGNPGTPSPTPPAPTPGTPSPTPPAPTPGNGRPGPPGAAGLRGPPGDAGEQGVAGPPGPSR